jgi:LmbE family N-acetylglucosaminyl deacetylase
VQYDSISRKRLVRQPFDTEAPTIRNEAVSHQAILGLFIVTVAAYVVGLAVGGTKPTYIITDSPIEQRTQNVVAALAVHPTDALVGEFWRILPASQAGGGSAALVPLADCTVATDAQSQYTQHSFAYLLNLDSQDAKLGRCSLEEVIAAYGRPSAITITAGTIEDPQEELLFYDQGSKQVRQAGGSGRPTDIAKLGGTACPGQRTILQIVAHEDDDLLFMGPDLLHSIQQGDCVRTMYLTAGDAGNTKFYWLGRERGSEAAYAVLGGMPDIWTTTTVKLDGHKFVSVAAPDADPRLSLIFMHLPDGKPDGQGFESSGFESLAKLASGEQSTIQSVDAQSIYAKAGLIRALQVLMETYQPAEVRTQRPDNPSLAYSDHSDHMTVGQLATAAFKAYQKKHEAARLAYYTGYPIRELPANVEGDDLAIKEQAFFTYAQYDGAVCGTVDVCMASGDYGDYLQRQYRTEL